MNALLPLGLVLLTLLAIAYLTWRFATVSRLRQTMGRPFILLGRACLLAADSCKRTYERTLAWSETYVIARLIYLAVAIGIFLGDYSISRLRGAALMGMDVQPISWLPLENFAGLLWLLVPAMLGAGALDLLEVIHEGWRLFSHLERIPKFLRIVLAGFMGMAFVLSLLVSALFVLWGQLALLQTATRIDQDQLALYIVAAFGILLAVVSCEAFYAVLVGLGALVSVAVGATYCVLRLLHLLLALCGDTIAGASPDYRPSYGQPAYTVVDAAAHIRALPPASPAQETDVSETTISEPESEELTRMATVYRTVTVLGYGLVSSRFVSLTLDYAAAAGAGGVLLGSAVIDPTHTYRRETLPTVSGVPNYTPTLQAMQNG